MKNKLSRYVKDLPNHFYEVIGLEMHGPNCWNTTIRWHDESWPQEWVSGNIMESWLEENTFSVNGDLQKGDILVFRAPKLKDSNWCAPGSDLIHTMILLDLRQKVIFHKSGIEGRFLIEKLNNVLKRYEMVDILEWRRFINYNSKRKAG